MNSFGETHKEVEMLLSKAKKVAKGSTLDEAGIDIEYMVTYGAIARRARDDREFLVVPYPYEQGPSVGAFNGGFFEHRHWSLRKDLEKHPGLRPVYEYECNYINAAGYWMAFHEAAIQLRQESIQQQKEDKAKKYDIWAQIAIRYGLRVTGLRCEFYKQAARDPVHAKLIMPTLEHRNDVPAADDLIGPLEQLESHMATQMMKAVATLSASNATRRNNGEKKKGGTAGKQ